MRHIVTIVLFSGLAFAAGWTLCGLASNKTYAEGLKRGAELSQKQRVADGACIQWWTTGLPEDLRQARQAFCKQKH
jgi:hypothetical protein